MYAKSLLANLVSLSAQIHRETELGIDCRREAKLRYLARDESGSSQYTECLY